MRAKYEFEIEDLNLKKTTNELLQNQETQIKELMADNAHLIKHSRKVEEERQAMSEVLTFISKDAELVKSFLDEEMAQFKRAKSQLSDLRRTNFILWKHIKKLKRKYRKLRVNNPKQDEPQQLQLSDDEEFHQIKQELDLLANDPDLAADLKQLKRSTKTVGVEVQTELLKSFYEIDTVVEMIGDEYLIIKRLDAHRNQGRRQIDDEGIHILNELQDTGDFRTGTEARGAHEKGEQMQDRHAMGIVSALQRSQIQAYYKAVQANQTLTHASRAVNESSLDD